MPDAREITRVLGDRLARRLRHRAPPRPRRPPSEPLAARRPAAGLPRGMRGDRRRPSAQRAEPAARTRRRRGPDRPGPPRGARGGRPAGSAGLPMPGRDVRRREHLRRALPPFARDHWPPPPTLRFHPACGTRPPPHGHGGPHRGRARRGGRPHLRGAPHLPHARGSQDHACGGRKAHALRHSRRCGAPRPRPPAPRRRRGHRDRTEPARGAPPRAAPVVAPALGLGHPVERRHRHARSAAAARHPRDRGPRRPGGAARDGTSRRPSPPMGRTGTTGSRGWARPPERDGTPPNQGRISSRHRRAHGLVALCADADEATWAALAGPRSARSRGGVTRRSFDRAAPAA